MPGFFTSARRAKDYPVTVGGVTGVTESCHAQDEF